MDKENNSRTMITQTPVNMEQGNPAGMAHVADYLIIIAYLLQFSSGNPMIQEEEWEEAEGEGAEARDNRIIYT